ncbi:MAG TPA: hypothetical protein PLA94_14630, partial [Myxococcota bacterium]|nr:hypothetical protein [Myxococcota bacterium]
MDSGEIKTHASNNDAAPWSWVKEEGEEEGEVLVRMYLDFHHKPGFRNIEGHLVPIKRRCLGCGRARMADAAARSYGLKSGAGTFSCICPTKHGS